MKICPDSIFTELGIPTTLFIKNEERRDKFSKPKLYILIFKF